MTTWRKNWQTTAHFVAAPPPPDWRQWLASRLQQRPRRIGLWGELALYGARQCLDLAHEPTLPAGALLRVGSRSGPLAATRAGIEQCRDGSPMPFVFLQSQPNYMLAALSRHLAWQGDAHFIVTRDTHALLALAQLESGRAGGLIGWVEEDAAGETARTEWWRFSAI